MVSEGGRLRPCFFLVIEFRKVIKIEGEKKRWISKSGHERIFLLMKNKIRGSEK